MTSATEPVAGTARERFLSALEPPPGLGAVPAFERGWLTGSGSAAPYLSYGAGEDDVNWSEELELLHMDAGEEHFIDVWTRRAVLDALASSPLPTDAVVADVGCSSGLLLREVAALWPQAFLVGVDAVPPGLEQAHRTVPGAAFFRADATALPFGDGTVDAITALNVLEHVTDDRRALREIRRVLMPGGCAVLVVPWNPGLYDHYDAFLQHERRYARGELAAKAKDAGLELRRRHHLGSLLYAPFWLAKKRNRLRRRPLASAEVRIRVGKSIRSTRRSRLGRLSCHVERSLLGLGVRLPVGIRELTVVERR